MYYEEKIINGVLHSRSSPYDKFTPVSDKVLTTMLKEARAEVALLKQKIEEVAYAAESYLQRC